MTTSSDKAPKRLQGGLIFSEDLCGIIEGFVYLCSEIRNNI
jgi:hypothetical protein